MRKSLHGKSGEPGRLIPACRDNARQSFLKRQRDGVFSASGPPAFLNPSAA